MKLTALVSLLLATLMMSATAKADHVVEGSVVWSLDCKTGFGFQELGNYFYSPLVMCLAKTNKVDLTTLVNKTIKIRADRRGGHDGVRHASPLIIKALNPDAPVGTDYRSFSDKITYGVAALAVPVAAVSASLPDQSAPAQSPNPPVQQTEQVQQANGNSYATGVNNCITAFFDKAYYNFYSYRNACGDKVNVMFLTQDGHGGSMDLDPGGHNATGDTPENLRKIGTYEFYACPYHFVAVDANGQRFTRPVTLFKCSKAY